MPSTDKDDRWFDVLTGRKDPQGREELIFSELRSRIVEDAAGDDYQLSELDLQRGKNALRSAAKSNLRTPMRPFLSGLAAGIAATAIGVTVLLSPIGDPGLPVTKDLPPDLTPSISREWPSPASLSSSVTALVDTLSTAGIAFELDSDGSQIVLSFKTPAPVPAPVASWLESNGIESLPATTYRLTVLSSAPAR
jgi:hypothetical protein